MIFIKSAPLLLQGLLGTLALSVCSLAISLVLGLFVGIATCRRIRVPILAPLLDAYCFCIRGIPFFVQLLIVYFVLPDLLRLNLPPFVAGVLALGICSTGYVAEIVRSGINALPKGQWDACRALGYSRVATLRHVIVPQMFVHAIPTFANECISVVLSTSIISQIGTLELTKVAANIIAREMNPMAVYGVVALLYLLITSAIMLIAQYLERRSHHAHRS